MNSSIKKFGDRLKYVLDDKKESINIFSKKLNVSEDEIEEYIKNITFPSLQRLIRIAMELNVSTDFLLGISSDYKNEKNIYIGDRLQEALRIRKISKELIIENTELSCDEFDMILNNRISPKLDILIELSKLIRVSSDYLLSISNDINENEMILKYKCKDISLTKESIQNILNSIEYLNWNIYQNNDE